MALSTEKTKRYYDRFGSKQDSQGFYEDAALFGLVDHAAFEQASSVFEFGCGTGRLAARLLEERLSSQATYLGTDISETMVALSTERLKPFLPRATVQLSNGETRFPLADRSVDRVLSAYVFDLLPEEGIAEVIEEAHRVLAPQGRLCCASLTNGRTLASKIVSGLWTLTYRVGPALVGGCRPIAFSRYIDPDKWNILYEEVFAPFGVPSEALVAEPRI